MKSCVEVITPFNSVDCTHQEKRITTSTREENYGTLGILCTNFYKVERRELILSLGSIPTRVARRLRTSIDDAHIKRMRRVQERALPASLAQGMRHNISKSPPCSSQGAPPDLLRIPLLLSWTIQTICSSHRFQEMKMYVLAI